MSIAAVRAETQLCPSCLDELPAGYPYDHVLIDRALAGNRAAWFAMNDDERGETVRVGLAHGRTYTQLSNLLRRSATDLSRYAGDATPTFDAQVKTLYTKGRNDTEIGLALGVHRRTVQTSRSRQQLPALYGPAGRRRWKQGTRA